MTNWQELQQVNRVQAAEELLRRRKARTDLLDFIRYTKPDYQVANFHFQLCRVLDMFATGKTKRLMIFAPPQHGKSECVSRRLPAYLLGINPKLKIVAASYADSLASAFNRDCQRIIDDTLYHNIFPDTYLNGSNVKTASRGGVLRNADIFETVNHRGFYKSVGVGGGLTGTPADVAIIDDPIKDAQEAYSARQRETVWNWYTDVLSTRLHNDSRVLITLTRWHEDDLAGRILKAEPDQWTVIKFPAIREQDENPYDSRQEGEALWPERHSLQRLLAMKQTSERTFAALYQQRPTAAEGNIMKRKWFEIVDMPDRVAAQRKAVLDTAYGDKTSNDPTGMLSYFVHNNDLYILDYTGQRMQFPDLVKFIPANAAKNGLSRGAPIKIEPKASGKSVVQQLRVNNPEYNWIEWKMPDGDKVARAEVIAVPCLEAGRVKLIRGSWNEAFIDRCCKFPNDVHDEEVDCLVMACDDLVNGVQKLNWA
jgi:predicted phage terminase large subunit-like protein